MCSSELYSPNTFQTSSKTHNSHKGDQAKFFRAAGNTLFIEEKELLGDIAGLSVVHLQCNAGQDTLSLSQLDAVVTGVDISDKAIDGDTSYFLSVRCI